MGVGVHHLLEPSQDKRRILGGCCRPHGRSLRLSCLRQRDLRWRPFPRGARFEQKRQDNHQGWQQDVDQGQDQGHLVDRESRGPQLAVQRSVETINAEEPEYVSVGEHDSTPRSGPAPRKPTPVAAEKCLSCWVATSWIAVVAPFWICVSVISWRPGLRSAPAAAMDIG